jgi:hypothetical protein
MPPAIPDRTPSWIPSRRVYILNLDVYVHHYRSVHSYDGVVSSIRSGLTNLIPEPRLGKPSGFVTPCLLGSRPPRLVASGSQMESEALSLR